MPSKGLRSASLSTDTEIDADDNAQKPLKPLLGIGAVGASFLFFYNQFKSFFILL
jgi:hypothetical protein